MFLDSRRAFDTFNALMEFRSFSFVGVFTRSIIYCRAPVERILGREVFLRGILTRSRVSLSISIGIIESREVTRKYIKVRAA